MANIEIVDNRSKHSKNFSCEIDDEKLDSINNPPLTLEEKVDKLLSNIDILERKIDFMMDILEKNIYSIKEEDSMINRILGEIKNNNYKYPSSGDTYVTNNNYEYTSNYNYGE